MALGNNSGKSTARYKGQIRQAIKERRDASGFTAFQGSALQGSDACSLDNSNVNITYYHNGSGVLPQVGDRIYTTNRLNDKFMVGDNKHLKVGPDRGRYFNVNYRSGAVSSVSAC